MANQVKIIPLSSVELARIAPLSEAEQREALKRLRKGKGYKSFYDGVHLNEQQIFNAATPLFEATSLTEKQIERLVLDTCVTEEEKTGNLPIVRGLRRLIAEKDMTARWHDFGRMPLRVGGTVCYWSNLLIRFGGRTYVPFIDPRLEKTKLTALGRQFGMSMQDTHIRAANRLEFGKVGLLIIQFKDEPKEGVREAILFREDGLRLWGMKELQSMIETTYRLWGEELQERAAKKRAA